MVYALSARSVAGTSATCRSSSQRLTASASGVRRQCVGWRGANAVDSLGSHSVPSFRTAVSAVRIGRRRSGARQSLHVRAVFEKFTERSIKIVMLAQQEARNLGSMEVRTEHIVVALTSEDPHFLLSSAGAIHVDSVRGAVATIIGKKKRRDIKTSELPFARDAKRVFETASAESRRMGLKFISPEHLEVAVLSSSEPSCRRVFDLLDVDPERLRNEAKKRILEEQGKEQVPAKKETAASGKVSSKKDGAAKALDEFCRDVCQDAREGRIDPIVGRDSELARTVQILARRTKNNPILLGEAGVGKTAIAEGLALAIVTGRTPDGLPLPPFLEEKRVLQLDLPKVLAGAKDRGELESRVTKIIAETKASSDVVLFIDEVHTLIGAGAVSRSGGSGSGLDVSNLMKPALARGELQCIGATTLDEFRKYIEKDAALERRFQPVYVEEPTNEQALAILGCLKATYERHHHCVYTSDALEAAVTLSRRYIMDRYLPDKAIDLLDEAGSRSRIASFRARQRMGHCETWGDEDRMLEALYIELTQVLDAKEEAVREGRYEEAHLLAVREGDLKGRLQGSAAEAPLLTVVKPDDIQAVVSAWTGVPADRLCEDERAKLLSLEPELTKTVIGQPEAVEHTAAALRRARSGFRCTNRPIATLLFSGPTGVGKTLLAKELADKYFSSPDSLISLDMSEYMERHMVSKLIGAPPGYVGYGEGGKLTEAVRRRPFCVLLLDEIEKAHPDVFNILLQVIEDGRLTDSQGRVVSFKNCLIIMTTNLGSNVIAKGGTRLGFHLGSQDPAEDSYQRIRGLVGEELKSCFRPELLNRIDEIIVFRQLQTQEMREIADLMLAETAERMAARDIGLQVTARCMDSIMESGFSQEWGARELRRAITHLVDDSLSDALLCGKVAAGDIAVVDVNAEGKVVVYETKEYLLELVKQQGQIIDIAYSSEPSKLPMERVRA